MTQQKTLLCGAALLLAVATSSAKIITVTTANNVSPGAGETSLVQAINQLEDGDTIQFNIPGAGPHFLITPPMVTGAGGGGGYPEITKNNVTIDGYSQPGASPNTNPILAPNNAQLKIVLDSRGGGAHVWDISGYGTSESGALVVSGNHVTIKGLCFLAIYGNDDDASPKRYGVALGNRGGNGTHINGCWFGVAPDGVTVAGMADGVTGFRHRTPTDVLVNQVVVGVKPGSANPRAEFNVMVDMCIPIIIEGAETRISGNFIGVLPDGVTRVPNPKTPAGFRWEAHIELARTPYNIVIGTDGDGVNDADERNVMSGGLANTFSSVTTEGTYDHIIEFYSGGTRTNTIIAGNYIGVDIHGQPMGTNATRLKNGWGNGAVTRVGSNFDGVSDDLEGNVIAGNHPLGTLFPSPLSQTPPDFMGLDNGERVSLRGNTLINCSLAPYSYVDRGGIKVGNFRTFMGNYMDTSVGYTLELFSVVAPMPVLDATSTATRLKGICPTGVAPYTTLYLDVYVQDPASWTNGIAFEMNEFAYWDAGSSTYKYRGFPNGGTYLGTFKDNGPFDADPAVGSFDLNIAALGLSAGTSVTVAANYTDALAAPTATITRSGTDVIISWPTTAARYDLQRATALPGGWTVVNPPPAVTQVGPNSQMVVPASGTTEFFRLSQQVRVQTGDFSMPISLQ